MMTNELETKLYNAVIIWNRQPEDQRLREWVHIEPRAFVKKVSVLSNHELMKEMSPTTDEAMLLSVVSPSGAVARMNHYQQIDSILKSVIAGDWVMGQINILQKLVAKHNEALESVLARILV